MSTQFPTPLPLPISEGTQPVRISEGTAADSSLPCSWANTWSSRQLTSEKAVSMLESIHSQSENVMQELRQLHRLIEVCYGAAVSEKDETPTRSTQGISISDAEAKMREAIKAIKKDDKPVQSTEIVGVSGSPLQNLGNPMGTLELPGVFTGKSINKGLSDSSQRIQFTKHSDTIDSGLPEFVKQFSDIEPPWALSNRMVPVGSTIEELASHGTSGEHNRSGEYSSMNGLVSSRDEDDGTTVATSNFSRNLAADFAMAQGWLKENNAGHAVKKTKLGRFVNSSTFDTYCAFVIVANSVLLAIATDYGASNHIGKESKLPSFFGLADSCFNIWFVAELTLRVTAAGPRVYWSFKNPMWTWNYFDTVVVAFSAIDDICRLFGIEGIGSNATALRTVRILRVARAMRVVRLFRFFRTLRMMILSILGSFTALFWALVLLAIIMFTFSIFLTQNVSTYLYEERNPYNVDASMLKKHFGRLIHTVYYLFLSISGGISWGEVSAPLFEIDSKNGLIFCFFIFACVFAMLNIITGIFLDTAIRAAQADKDESIAEQLHSEDSTIGSLQTIFGDADLDGSGDISAAEFERHLSDDRVRAHLASLGIEAGKASALFRLLDLDNSGSITVDEFLFGCMRIRGGAKGLDVATLLYENKRLVHKWSIFMTYVEKEFKSIKKQNHRIGDLIHRLIHSKLKLAGSSRGVGGASQNEIGVSEIEVRKVGGDGQKEIGGSELEARSGFVLPVFGSGQNETGVSDLEAINNLALPVSLSNVKIGHVGQNDIGVSELEAISLLPRDGMRSL